MEKNNLLPWFKYYKGEKECPYKGNNAMMWQAEEMYLQESNKDDISPVLESIIDDYMQCGLSNFEMDDGIPIYFKAILFNMYGKYISGSQTDAANSFMKLYKSY